MPRKHCGNYCLLQHKPYSDFQTNSTTLKLFCNQLETSVQTGVTFSVLSVLEKTLFRVFRQTS